MKRQTGYLPFIPTTVRMYIMDNRTLKDLLYEQVARVGKALASPKRLEMLEMLAQGEKAVETVAAEFGLETNRDYLARSVKLRDERV